MSMRNEFYTKMQFGLEASYGAGGAATKIAIGQAPRVVTDTKTEMPVEQFGARINKRRAIPYQRLYTSTRSIANAGFQQLILPLETGLKHVTPVGASSPYTWTFEPNLSVAAGLNSPKSFVAQLGDGEQAWIVPGCHTDRITLKGSVAQDGGSASVSLEQSYFGQKIDEGTFTASLSTENSTPMNAKYARLYWDTAWASLGSTEVTDALVEFTFELMTGMHPISRGGAENYPQAAAEGLIDYTLALRIDSALRDEMFASQQAGEKIFTRLEIGNGADENNSLVIDLACLIEDVTPIDGADRGDNLSSVALTSAFDDTSSKALKIVLLTTQNAV